MRDQIVAYVSNSIGFCLLVRKHIYLSCTVLQIFIPCKTSSLIHLILGRPLTNVLTFSPDLCYGCLYTHTSTWVILDCCKQISPWTLEHPYLNTYLIQIVRCELHLSGHLSNISRSSASSFKKKNSKSFVPAALVRHKNIGLAESEQILGNLILILSLTLISVQPWLCHLKS